MLDIGDSIRSRQGADYEAFARGLRGMVAKLRERQAEVQEVLEAVDDHTRTFLNGHRWASLPPEEFIRAVLEEL